jgi:hypothetical protein
MALSLTSIAAAPVPPAQSAKSALCIPLLMKCPSPPAPSPAGPGIGGTVGGAVDNLGKGVLGATPVLPGGGGADSPIVLRDRNAPVMTPPAAQLGGSSLSIQGLHSLGLVSVPLAGGKHTTVIRISADDVAIDGFLLDVRRETGPSAVTNASRMELKGRVVIYLNSLSATLLGGAGISLGTDKTPIPGKELPSTLLRPTLGLVGVTAGSITFTNNDLFVS